MGSLEQLHHGGTRRHAVTHTVVCMMWTLAPGKRRVKNKSDSRKQTVTMATEHRALKMTNIHVSSANVSQLKQAVHAPIAWLLKSYAHKYA